MLQTTTEILSQIKSLEPFPDVALRVVQLSTQEDVVPEELIAVIETDPGLTAKVLKLCNSAYYGFQREIASMRDAGNLLGVKALVNLVVTSSASRYFRNYGALIDNAQTTLWERSVANGLASRLLASLRHEVDTERAYTAGLLQNIGHIVLERFLHKEREQIAQELGGGAQLLEAEQHVLGLHHAELGARLATRWNFPDELVDAIRFHHQPERAEEESALTDVMHLAESLTWSVGYGEGFEGRSYGVSKSCIERGGVNKANFDAMKSMLTREITRAKDLVAVAA